MSHSSNPLRQWVRSKFASKPGVTIRTRKPSIELLEDRVNPAPYSFPSDNSLFFQTSGPLRPATIGDWYTTAAAKNADHIHRISVEITAEQLGTAGGNITITVEDPQSSTGSTIDEVQSGVGDPTRFALLGTDGKTVLDSKRFAANAGAPSNYTFAATITAPGIYTVTSETGSTYIDGVAIAGQDDDDNSYKITVSEGGVAATRGFIGYTQATFQQNTTGDRSFYFLVGPATTGLFLRNFDLDGGVSKVLYEGPSKAVAGTASGNGLWNGPTPTLDTGGDTISGLTAANAGVWKVTFFGYTANNQSLFEANTADGERITVLDQPPNRAGNFDITPDTTLRTTLGVSVDHPFTVTNNFTADDIVELTPTGTAANWTAVLLNSDGTPVVDNNGDGVLDTGLLAPGETRGFILRVTPNAGAGAADTTVIDGVSLLDTLVGSSDVTRSVVKTTVLVGTLAGSVFRDDDNSGGQNGAEPGIGGAFVTLTGTDFLGTAVSLKATTAANGSYSFGDLAQGKYKIVETQPAGFLDGKDKVGTSGGTLGNDVISDITFAAGVNATGYTFGELLPASLAGVVYQDANLSGGFNAGDVGIVGAVVTLTGTDDLGAAVKVAATTGIGGAYSFLSVRPGTYTLTETQPAGYLDGPDTKGSLGGTLGNDVVSAITVVAGNAGTGYNFGEIGPAISGTVFVDGNRDGAINGPDGGFKGVVVTAVSGATTLTATTDASGNYSFTNVAPGKYTVTSVTPGGFGTSTAVTRVADATAGSSTGNNFGLTVSTLAGTVFRDDDASGVQNGAEPGLPGVLVSLVDAAGNPALDAFGTVVAPATTAANGTYAFAGLLGGNYKVVETQPVGFDQGKNAAGSFGGTVTGDTVSVAVPLGKDGTGYNFGELVPSTSIAGTVYVDRNNNGVIDGGEPGIAGVVVVLTGTDDLGAAVNLTATTAAGGVYSFPGLRPGTYTLTETQPAQWNDGTDSKGNFGGTAGNDTITTIVLASGNVATGYNFGERGTALSGTAFFDANTDGALDGGDKGQGKVVVTLTDGVQTFTATTAADGTYSFGDLPTGKYTVAVTAPTGFGTSTPVSKAVTLPLAGSTGNDFGFTLGSLAGTVFQDDNNNGGQNGTEPGIAGVLVSLVDAAGNPVTDGFGVAIAPATTAADGSYKFVGVLAGTYKVLETQPAGFLDGKDAAGTAGGTVGNDVISGVTVGAGVNATGYTFGELQAASLAGFVFADANANGAFDGGESGIGGVTVTLTGTDDLGAAVKTAVTTGAGGAYSFPGLRPGTYTITETQPAAFNDGLDTVGSLGGTLGNDVVSAIVVTSGAAGTGYNFGEIGAGLSGTVFVDGNRDGAINGPDGGFQGVIVTATDGKTTVTATTDAAGNYSFTNLLPGDYTITSGTPGGFGTSTPTTKTVTLTTNGSTGNNFGLTVSTLAGTVFRDDDASGVQNGAEPGLPGVLVSLVDNAGNPALDAFGKAVAPAITAADGTYAFAGILGGNYKVVETQPVQYATGTNTAGTFGGTVTGDTIAVTVPTGKDGTAYNFGELGGTVSGSVYNDANNDGIRGPGEVGLPGVVVVLADGDGTPVGTATTGPDGTYTFTGLIADTYSVTEPTQPAGLLDGSETRGNTTPLPGTATTDEVTGIALTPGGTAAGNNFGELSPAAVGDFVFEDTNGNGVQDGGELGLVGVVVTLTGTDDLGAVSLTATTGPGGVYSFGGIRPGTYQVGVTAPAGFTVTTPNVGNDAADSDIVPATGQTAPFTLAAGQTDTTIDAGLFQGSSISGLAFTDVDGDGVRTAADTPLPGVVVTLLNAGGNPVGTTTTGPDGSYTFTGVPPGDYSVSFGTPPGLQLTAPNIGDDTADSDPAPATGLTTPFTVVSGVSTKAVDAGYYTPATLGDLVWLDQNGDGVRQPNEPGLAGVTVTATGAGPDGVFGNADDTTASVTTGADGKYTVTGLAPGKYAVAVSTLPAGAAVPTFDLDGTGTPNTATLTIVSGDTRTDADFGVQGTGVLGDFVWSDANGNGVQDPGEAGLPGVVLTLTWPGTDGDFGTPADNLTLTATTGPDGKYSFGNLPAGNFQVTIDPATVPAILAPTFDLDGVGTPLTTTATLAPDQVRADLDFGFASLGTVTGVVSVVGTNAPIPGVTVTLTGTDTLGNPVTLTTTTGPDGSYTFVNVPPGDYTVTETQPTGYGNGTPNVVPVTLPPAGTATVNFGETTGSLGGTAYTDTNLSGTFDAGDAPLPGVIVTLTGTDDLGNPVTQIATTGPDGKYNFTGLLGGTYTLTETQPAGLLDGPDAPGTAGGTAGNDLFSAVTLAGGTVATGYLFGEFAATQVFGFAYNDANANGVRDTGEAGIPGVRVTISGTAFAGTPSERPLTAADVAGGLTATTGADGRWAFAALPPGVYTITEAQPAGFLDGREQNAGGLTATVGNDVFTAVRLTAATNGPLNFGEFLPARADGSVVVDTTGAGIPGVTVTLTGTNDLGQPVRLTTTTDAAGNYSFGDLRPGTYSVTFAPPPGVAIVGADTIGGVTLQPGGRVGSLIFRVTAAPRDVPLAPVPPQTLPTADPLDPSKREFLSNTPIRVPGGMANLPVTPGFANSAATVGRTDGRTTPILVATGADAGRPPEVRVFDYATNTEIARFLAYEATFTGGVRVAVADLDGDGIDEIITAPGVGGGPLVRVFDRTGRQLNQVLAYAVDYRGGLWVAAGDTDGDGRAEIVTGADVGGGPHVRVLDGVTGGDRGSWFAYDPSFRGGVRVAVGDTDGDGRAEVITAAGLGGGPDIRTFTGTGTLVRNFLAYEPTWRGGMFVATGDLNGDGIAEIVTAPGAGGGPVVRAFNGVTNAAVANFFAFDAADRAGVRVATADLNADGRDDILAGSGLGGGSHVRAFDARAATLLEDFFADDPAVRGGVFLG